MNVAVRFDRVLMDFSDSFKDQVSNQARRLPGRGVETNGIATAGETLGLSKLVIHSKEG